MGNLWITFAIHITMLLPFFSMQVLGFFLFVVAVELSYNYFPDIPQNAGTAVSFASYEERREKGRGRGLCTK